MLAVSASAMLGVGFVPDAGMLPALLSPTTALAVAGDSLLPRPERIERKPPDRNEIQYWYEGEIAKEQARYERNLRKIDLRFQEQWPGSGEERQRAYDRARQRETDRYERERRELQREFEQKFRR